jgi:general stress protein 26
MNLQENVAQKKQLVLDFISTQRLAVISTVSSNGQPQSAVMEFGQTEDLALIFDTFTTYRKYQNLRENPQVSFVIGWDNNITVQYEGKATELKGEEREQYQEVYFQKNPKAKRWLKRSEIVYFKVTPTWIRYSNLSVNPWQIFELNF